MKKKIKIQGRPPTHGMTKTPLYNAWRRMVSRCRHKHPKNKYIERGITVSSEWKTFENFFRDMAETYSKGLTLERINNNAGYSKENCRWATQAEQARNRSTTVRVIWEGEEVVLQDLAERFNIPYGTFWARFHNHGWPLKEALTTPVMSAVERGKRSIQSPNHINNKRALKRSESKELKELKVTI